MSNQRDLQGRDELAIAERAAAWLSALRHEDGEDRRAAFAEWLRESPRHVEEVLFASTVERALAGFDAKGEIDVEEILREAPGNVVQLKEKAHLTSALSPLGRRRGRKTGWVVAAGMAMAAVAGWVAIDSFGGERYSTSIGEQRAVELDDGSLVYLNTHSRVRVRFTADGRDIELLQGEALFKVAQEAGRPFRVHTADAVIQALGTQFNVYRRTGGTIVSVIDGRVRVAHGRPAADTAGGPTELVAGEAAEVAAERPIVKQPAPDLAQATAWRQRRLVFQADTLEDIAAEFNRYNRTPQIQIEGEAARQTRFTGVFDADDPMSLVQLLGKDRELTFEERADGLVLKSRPGP